MHTRKHLPIHVDKTRLRNLYIKQRKTLLQISIQLGVSISTVRNRLISDGLLRKPRPKPDIDEIKRLYEDLGWTLHQIGEKYGVTRQAIQQNLKQAGVPRKGPGRRADNQLQVIKKKRNLKRLLYLYCDKEMSIVALTRRFGVSWSNLQKILVSEGIKIRPLAFYLKRPRPMKYPQLVGLEVGSSAEITLAQGTRFTSGIITISKKRGMKVSVKKIGLNRYRVTRVR